MFSILRPYIFSLDPEVAHDLAIKSLKFNIIPKSFFQIDEEEMLEIELFKRKLKNPSHILKLKNIQLTNRANIAHKKAEVLIAKILSTNHTATTKNKMPNIRIHTHPITPKKHDINKWLSSTETFSLVLKEFSKFLIASFRIKLQSI